MPLVPMVIFASLIILGGLGVLLGESVQDKKVEAGRLAVLRDFRLDQEREQRLAANVQSVAESRLAEAQEQETVLESGLSHLKLEMDTLVARLETITGDALPIGVQLTGLVPGREGISLAGTSDSYEAVLQYAANLRESSHFEGAAVVEAAGSGDGTFGFTVLAIIPQPAAEDEDP